MQLFDHLIIGGLLIFLPLRLLAAGQTEGGGLPTRFSHQAKLVLYYGNSLLLWLLAAAVCVVWWSYGRPWGELGLQWGATPYGALAQALIVLFGILYILDVFLETERAAKEKNEAQLPAFLPATGREFIHYSLLAISAGLAEEIVYRGYCISYLLVVIGDDSWWRLGLVLLLPALAFGLGHIYQGWWAVLKIILMAVLFGAIFWLTNSLWVLMLLHVAVDLIGGLLGWKLMREAGQDRR